MLEQNLGRSPLDNFIALDKLFLFIYYTHIGSSHFNMGIVNGSCREKEKKMQPSHRDPEALLPLTPAVFHILLSLADGERHGYSILREISAQTRGKLHIGPTTLYRSIRQLLETGLIEESDERPDPALDDERRRYYRLSEFGRQVAVAEVKRLDEVLAIAHSRRELRDILPAPARGSIA